MLFVIYNKPILIFLLLTCFEAANTCLQSQMMSEENKRKNKEIVLLKYKVSIFMRTILKVSLNVNASLILNYEHLFYVRHTKPL